MNSVIDSIADKAGIGAWGDEILVINPDDFGGEVIERFALLIVEECLAKIREVDPKSDSIKAIQVHFRL